MCPNASLLSAKHKELPRIQRKSRKCSKVKDRVRTQRMKDLLARNLNHKVRGTVRTSLKACPVSHLDKGTRTRAKVTRNLLTTVVEMATPSLSSSTTIRVAATPRELAISSSSNSLTTVATTKATSNPTSNQPMVAMEEARVEASISSSSSSTNSQSTMVTTGLGHLDAG